MRTTGRKRWERERQSVSGRKGTGKRRSAEPTNVNRRRHGTPTTRYRNDPLGGNPRHHAIVKKAKQNWSARKIAKSMDLPLKEVRRVLAEAGL